MDKNLELVMGIARYDLFKEADLYFQGFKIFGDAGFTFLKQIHKNASFRHRGNCETDKYYKQVIPYCLLMRDKKVFVYTRNGGGEDRLNGLSSIGIGGHINPDKKTCDIYSTIQWSMFREIDEEVKMSSYPNNLDYKNTFSGYINDDENPVGKVHFGLVYRIDLDSGVEVETREKELKHGQFVKIDDLKNYSDNWERWSQILIDHLEDWA